MTKELPVKPFVIACKVNGIEQYYCGNDSHKRPLFYFGDICWGNVRTKYYQYRKTAERQASRLKMRHSSVDFYVKELPSE